MPFLTEGSHSLKFGFGYERVTSFQKGIVID